MSSSMERSLRPEANPASMVRCSRVSSGQSGVNVHTLMEDTDDFDVGAGLAVKDHMPPDIVFAVSLTDLVTGTTPAGLLCQKMKNLIQAGQIAVSLVPAPRPLRIAADVSQIGLGFRGEAEGRHSCELYLSRASSNPVNEYAAMPLSSPSFKAWRKAVSFISCSSSSRRPARMASLADENRPRLICSAMKVSKCSPKVTLVFFCMAQTSFSIVPIYNILWYKATALGGT